MSEALAQLLNYRRAGHDTGLQSFAESFHLGKLPVEASGW
jgi:hypothetical protein